jgi:hypothetical protein
VRHLERHLPTQLGIEAQQHLTHRAPPHLTADLNATIPENAGAPEARGFLGCALFYRFEFRVELRHAEPATKLTLSFHSAAISAGRPHRWRRKSATFQVAMSIWKGPKRRSFEGSKGCR